MHKPTIATGSYSVHSHWTDIVSGTIREVAQVEMPLGEKKKKGEKEERKRKMEREYD